MLFVALLHGMYNFLSSFQFGFFTGTLVEIVGLIIAVQLYIHLIERSPYNTLPLHRAGEAVPRLHRGLDFNPSSTILNRNLGFYLLYLGRYRESAMQPGVTSVPGQPPPGVSSVPGQPPGQPPPPSPLRQEAREIRSGRVNRAFHDGRPASAWGNINL